MGKSTASNSMVVQRYQARQLPAKAQAPPPTNKRDARCAAPAAAPVRCRQETKGEHKGHEDADEKNVRAKGANHVYEAEQTHEDEKEDE